MQEVSAPVLSSLFTLLPAGKLNVMVNGEAELADGEYVSGDFFRGLALPPAAGRLLMPETIAPARRRSPSSSRAMPSAASASAADAVGQQF